MKKLLQKLVLKLAQKLFPFEAVSALVLETVNAYLAKDNVADNVKKALDYLDSLYKVLSVLADKCPAEWKDEYLALLETVKFLIDTLDDCEVSPAELQAAVEGVKIAIAKWNQD